MSQSLSHLERSVHPRMRGEHEIGQSVPAGHRFIPACAGNTLASARLRSPGCVGSSPHARGTRLHTEVVYLHRRFIPACAGNTQRSVGGDLQNAGSSPHARGTLVASSVPPDTSAVHPRMRGEHGHCQPTRHRGGSSPHARGTRQRRGSSPREPVGSSPHARGTPLGECGQFAIARFIPACAGNTGRSRPYAAGGSSPHARGTLREALRVGVPRPVHPRMRGEHRLPSLHDVPCRPVHPRMRGEHVQRVRVIGAACGSSPHARGTLADPLIRVQPAVHPRMRGEHDIVRVQMRDRRRFIPACAGNTATPRRTLPAPRFIPACAGNTESDRASQSASAVHPRMRGEHVIVIRDRTCPAGSSPHARGTRAVGLRCITAWDGSSPHARGTPHLVQVVARARAVHPRMRGEHAVDRMVIACRARFIPACAGNTAPRIRHTCARHAVHPRMRGEHA